MSIFHRANAASNNTSYNTLSQRRKRNHRSGNSLTTLIGGLILLLVILNFYLFTFIVRDVSLPVTNLDLRSRFVNTVNGNSVSKDDVQSDTDTPSDEVADETLLLLIPELKSYSNKILAWRLKEREQVKAMRENRTRQRKNRARSPLLSDSKLLNELDQSIYHHPHADTSTNNLLPTYDDPDNRSNSTVKFEFCGVHAQNASQLYPNHYKHHLSLNNNSKVLITGILSPLGFHLALKLATQCHVQVMLAVDPIYPNHFTHRLRAQQYIAILTKLIPKLQMPIIIPFVGLDRRNPPQDSQRKRIFFHTTGEINYSFFKVTHVIHLASSDPYLYRDYLDDNYQERYFYDHNYVTEDRLLGHLFGFRQSLVSMEQMLMALSTPAEDVEKGNIQMTYITTSATIEIDDNDPQRMEDHNFFITSKAVDELMARTYSKLKQVATVAVRIPTVYGPVGRHGSLMYELAEKASKQWNKMNHLKQTNKLNNTNASASSILYQTSLLEMIGYKGSAEKDMKNLLFVDDAVDAIVTAMQLAIPSSTALALDISSIWKVAVRHIATFIESQMTVLSQDGNDSALPPVMFSHNVPSRDFTNQLIQWSPTTTLEIGARRLLSWHLDKNIPFGSSKDMYDMKPNLTAGVEKENGNDFLVRKKDNLCAPDDLYCLRGKVIYPCISECASLKQCQASPFDDVKHIAWSFSSGCHTVVYTSFLGKRLIDINHTAPTIIDQKHMGAKDVCSVAFLSKESPLITRAIDSLSHEQLIQMDVIYRLQSETEEARLSRYMYEMNGLLTYQGWTLIWLNDSDEPSKIEHPTIWLAPLSPKRLFHPSVQYAMYLSDATILTPTSEDVLFLTSQMSRQAQTPRKEKQRIGLVSSDKELGLASEPIRKVGLLVGALRLAAAEDPIPLSPRNKKISWLEARKKMSLEIVGREDVNETQSVQRQRESYERIQLFVNSPQLRSPYAKLYKYDVYHWARTRWLLHDVQFETSRKFRCDWYQEHLLWQSDYEQLSFAHVMARREVERRILRHEPDDVSRRASRLKEDPDIDRFTDRNDWHMIIDPYEDELLTSYTTAVPFVDEPKEDRGMIDPEDNARDLQRDDEVHSSYRTSYEEKDIYVRIMGEQWAKYYRQRWNRNRDNH